AWGSVAGGGVGPAAHGLTQVPPARGAVQHHLGPGATGRVRRPPGGRLHAPGRDDGMARHHHGAGLDRRGHRRWRRGSRPYSEDDGHRSGCIVTGRGSPMRGKGINYDTGFRPGGENSREHFNADVVGSEMRIIARELHCTAVRISCGEPARLSIAGELAAAEGLEVWFAPFPCELTTDQLAPLFEDCAGRAEHLRRSGANVVLVTGCELTLFGDGFLPGGTVFERIRRLRS